MFNILKASFFRYFRSKLFIATIILLVVLPIFTTGLQYLLQHLINDQLGELGGGTFVISAVALFLMALTLVSDFGMVFVIFAVVILVDDFNHNTIRNPIIAGYPKLKQFFATLILILSISVVSLAINAISTYIYAGLMFGFYGVDWVGQAWATIIYLLASAVTLTFAVFIVYWLKNTAFSILIVVGSLFALSMSTAVLVMSESEVVINILMFIAPVGLINDLNAGQIVGIILTQLFLAAGFIGLGAYISHTKDYK